MFQAYFLSVIIIVSAVQICSGTDGDELIAAHVLHRHGDRNIYSVYPKDPFRHSRFWPGGLGALTKIGERQTLELGQYLRWKYYHLIGGTYSDKKMYYRSTNRRRTIKSAESCAAGLYPGTRVPTVHVVPSKKEYLLHPGAKCPRYEKLLDDYLESRKVVGIWKKHRPMIRYIERHSGKRLRSFTDIATIYDILYVEDLKGFNLPRWARDFRNMRQKLEYLVGIHLESLTHTRELKQLKAGYLLVEILRHFYDKIESKLHPDRNLWIYSAHDTTMAILLNALNVFDNQVPPYASSLHFELYKRDRDYYVQIIYRKPEIDNNPRPLYIPNCGVECHLDDFLNLYKHILPTENFASACRLR